jgi:spermidine synthase
MTGGRRIGDVDPQARAGARARAATIAIFFLSGVSGLVYQVVWVRRFAAIFGNTIHSAALVTSVFMGGLGLGSYVLGRVADRHYLADPSHALRLYARLELGIAATGLALAVLLPRLAALSAPLSSYVTGEHGWHELSTASYVARYAAAVVLVAPATFMMGGTLTVLVRALVGRDLDAAPVRIALLYGVNTAGAALGAWLTDFALVPGLGLFATQVLAVALNASAGALALVLVRRGTHAAEHPAGASPRETNAPRHAGATRALALTGAAVMLSGFAAMGLEIVWFRYLSGLLGALRAVFSLLLAVLLAGIWLGSIAGGALHRRFGHPARLFFATQTLFAISALALLLGPSHAAMHREHVAAMRGAFAGAGPWLRAALAAWSTLRPVLLVVGLPSLLMGAAFPLANAAVQRAEGEVGARAGLVYLANTLGNVLGSALVGFSLLPAFGAQRTAIGLGLCAIAATVPLAFGEAAATGARPKAPFALGVAAATAGALAFFAVPRARLLEASLPADDAGGTTRVLSVDEGLDETIAIVEAPGFFRQLYTNGHSMTTNAPKSQRYMRAFAHVPLLSLEHPERVLVICFGVGNTANAASLHPVERVEIADLSRGVLEHAPFFAATNGSVLEDPRTAVFVDDGRHHLLLSAPGSFDLVTLEPPPLAFAGVAALYSREFYELARSRLRTGGYLTQWLPAYQVPGEVTLALVRAFVDVFPEAVLLSGDDNELILMGTTGPSIRMDLDAIQRRLAARPKVAADLGHVDLGDPTELVGMFAASASTLRAATRGVAPMIDDRPVLEYSRRSRLGSMRMPPAIFDTSRVEEVWPGALSRVPRLADYLRVRGAIYASDRFLAKDGAAPLALPTDDGAKAAIAASPYLTTLLGGAGAAPRRAGEEHLRAGRLEDALGALRYAAELDPEDPLTFVALGEALAKAGDLQRAAFALDRATTLDPNSAAARFSFAAVLAAVGERRGAIAELRAGLRLRPDDEAARARLDALLASAPAE